MRGRRRPLIENQIPGKQDPGGLIEQQKIRIAMAFERHQVQPMPSDLQDPGFHGPGAPARRSLSSRRRRVGTWNH